MTSGHQAPGFLFANRAGKVVSFRIPGGLVDRIVRDGFCEMANHALQLHLEEYETDEVPVTKLRGVVTLLSDLALKDLPGDERAAVSGMIAFLLDALREGESVEVAL